MTDSARELRKLKLDYMRASLACNGASIYALAAQIQALELNAEFLQLLIAEGETILEVTQAPTAQAPATETN